MKRTSRCIVLWIYNHGLQQISEVTQCVLQNTQELDKKNSCDVHAMTCFFWQHFKKRVAGRVLCVVLAVSKL